MKVNLKKVSSREIGAIPFSLGVESLVFFSLYLVIDWFLVQGDWLGILGAHPFWILILLSTFQYGVLGGSLVALVSTIIYFIQSPLSLNLIGLSDIWALSMQPAQWFIAALVFGDLRHRQFEREIEQSEKNISLDHEISVLIKDNENLKVENESLKTQASMQFRTARTVFESVSRLDKLSPKEVLAGIPNLIETAIKPKKYSIYQIQKSGLTMKYSKGWQDKQEFDSTILKSSTLYQSLIHERKTLSVIDKVGELTLAGNGILAAPITSAYSNQVVVVVKIEEMDFNSLHAGGLDLFNIIANVIGSAYGKAEQYVYSLPGAEGYDTRLAMPAATYSQLSVWLSGLAQRMDFGLWELTIQCKPEAVHSSKLQHVIVSINRLVQNFRKTDLFFDLSESDLPSYSILLSGIDKDKAWKVMDKFYKNLEEQSPGSHHLIVVNCKPISKNINDEKEINEE